MKNETYQCEYIRNDYDFVAGQRFAFFVVEIKRIHHIISDCVFFYIVDEISLGFPFSVNIYEEMYLYVIKCIRASQYRCCIRISRE